MLWGYEFEIGILCDLIFLLKHFKNETVTHLDKMDTHFDILYFRSLMPLNWRQVVTFLKKCNFYKTIKSLA